MKVSQLHPVLLSLSEYQDYQEIFKVFFTYRGMKQSNAQINLSFEAIF